jgi:hypothetical protein
MHHSKVVAGSGWKALQAPKRALTQATKVTMRLPAPANAVPCKDASLSIRRKRRWNRFGGVAKPGIPAERLFGWDGTHGFVQRTFELKLLR